MGLSFLFQEVKKTLFNKLSIVIIVLTFLWCFFDASSRLMLNKNLQNSETAFIPVNSLSLPQLSANEYEKLQQIYQKYNKNDTSNETIQGMTSLEQSKQNGILNDLFVEDYKLSLKAVIKEDVINKDKISALLAIQNIKTGENKIKKFNHLDKVYGYQLHIDKSTQVVLTKKREQDLQTVTLTMYTQKQ